MSKKSVGKLSVATFLSLVAAIGFAGPAAAVSGLSQTTIIATVDGRAPSAQGGASVVKVRNFRRRARVRSFRRRARVRGFQSRRRSRVLGFRSRGSSASGGGFRVNPGFRSRRFRGFRNFERFANPAFRGGFIGGKP
ncbi:MAG: hypothetical protein AAFQ99_10605 [Pseudomonadota bacterium]